MNLHTTETPGSDTDETKLRIVCRERLGGRLKHYSLKAAYDLVSCDDVQMRCHQSALDHGGT